MTDTDVIALQLLEDLLIAVESDPQTIDIGRVSGFLQKVCIAVDYEDVPTERLYRSETVPSESVVESGQSLCCRTLS